jgi:hypothetical protein
MIAVSSDEHYAAARFALLSGGRFKRSKTEGYGGGALLEYVTEGGEVIARKVEALGGVACWLRADLAELARDALVKEAADYEAVIGSLGEFIRSTDAQGAARNNSTVEQYRAKRHAAGNRWDKYRHAQRVGS